MYKSLLVVFILIISLQKTKAQSDSADKKNRLQYPIGLRNGNYGISLGYINYNFGTAQLEPGFTASPIHVPHVALRVNIIGYRISNNLSANIHYLRPIGFVTYKNVPGSTETFSVVTNYAGLTLKTELPIEKKMRLYAEAGLGIVTRKGFEVNYNWVVKNAGYATAWLEGGLRYKVSKKIDLIASSTFIPGKKSVKQPATQFHSVGFTNNMRPFTNEQLARKKKYNYIWPKNMVQLGISTNAVGYGVNNFASLQSPIPFFWGGDIIMKGGASLQYSRNIWHSKKLFSFDWAAAVGVWKTKFLEQSVFTLSVFPILRFNLIHGKKADGYFYYSVAAHERI